MDRGWRAAEVGKWANLAHESVDRIVDFDDVAVVDDLRVTRAFFARASDLERDLHTATARKD